MAETMYALPENIEAFRGEIMDTDAHEQIPINRWEQYFGPVVKDIADAIGRSTLRGATPYEKDDTPITPESVWTIKKGDAPGCFDFKRRLEVMDYIGVRRQLMFPGSYGLLAVAFYYRADDPTLFKSITGDRRGYARKTLDAYNNWCVDALIGEDRLRPAIITLQDTVEDLIADTARLLKKGIRAFWIPCAKPLAGLSPAHPDLDPFWAMIAEANAAVVSHVGADEGFLATMKWRDAPAFDGWKGGEEFALDPWTLSSVHRPIENFLSVMIMGGVFDRHPTLRFGACESTGHWIGPLGQNLDIWHEHSRMFQQNANSTYTLPMKPSDYIKRNVRISVFPVEPVDAYIDQFGMTDVYCFGTDFPHPEGGRDPMGDLSKKLERHGPEVLRKFFVENAKWIMPD